MTMNMFIDTNVFLSFYDFKSEDLKELARLTAYIEEKTIRLYLPEQVKHEFRRNRERTIADAMKRLKNLKLMSEFPRMCMSYGDYRVLRKKLHECSEVHKSLVDTLEKDIVDENLETDRLIAKVFSAAFPIKTTQPILVNARDRIALGNPPGKANSLGDALNWETLLATVPASEDLYLVSYDGDFQSPYRKTYLHSYLDKEWKDVKESRLYFFTSLADAFKALSLQIRLSEYLEKRDAIRELEFSPNFRDTHIAIARLEKYESGFDRLQLNKILCTVALNNQVGWIFWDEDVQYFFWRLIDGRQDEIYRETLEVFQPWMQESLSMMELSDIPPRAMERCQQLLGLDPSQAESSEDDIPF